MKKIISIIGARPQFIKHATMQIELQKHFQALTIHTGQHYDANMSEVFFNELNIPQPDYLFDIGGSKPQGEQTGIMMIELEKVFSIEKPDAVLVYGDTNSTLAAALAAVKMQIPQIHVEAGLRSFNRTMPEEINRIVADEFAELLFCPSENAVENLKKEGISHKGIFLCGDVMCDTLRLMEGKAKRLYELSYYFATIHRPYNTDNSSRLKDLFYQLNNLDHKVILPLHPRTANRLSSFGLTVDAFSNIEFIEPIGYLESLSYQKYAECIITDSGGMQKEAYMLQKKCITLRSETEWVETLHNGWNTLLFDDLNKLQALIKKPCGAYMPDIYGQGTAAKEIVDIIKDWLN